MRSLSFWFILFLLLAALAIPVQTSAQVTTSRLFSYSPTFVGPASTGCASPGCALLTGPFPTDSTASLSEDDLAAARELARPAVTSGPREMERHNRPSLPRPIPDPPPPTVSCQPLGAGCDVIIRGSGGATGVKGLNAVDSGLISGEDIEPPDQGLCAGNGYVVETNNIGEILVFDSSLNRLSGTIPDDTLMGLTARGWSSGGDPSCLYDYANGGHWFFTEIVSSTSEASGGTFAGCFAAVANTCYEGIAVSTGSSPFGPYNVYFLSGDYNPAEPGYPYLLNDFAKISSSRDAFLMYYDEFPLNGNVPGLGGGFFNGSQEFAFDKKAMEEGRPASEINVAIQNMGLLQTPDGSCFEDNTFHLPGITCWFSVVIAIPPDPSQYDNGYGGSAFMLNSLDYYGNGDTRIAVFAWTGLSALNSAGCGLCGEIKFSGWLLSGGQTYYGEGFIAAQKTGPIPLGNECGEAKLSSDTSCPENGIATNGDFLTQVTQGQGQIWGATTTEVEQTFSSEASPEVHQGAAYWVVNTSDFDSTGTFSLTSQGYVSPAHEELEFPAMATGGFAGQDGGNGRAIMTFTISGNGGPNGADNGGFYPSTAYGRLTSTSGGLLESAINVSDLGQSPEDGFTEYNGYPGPLRPRWGDYSNAIFVPGPGGGRIFFATNYIQYFSCPAPAFTLAIGTCDGTRDGYANWGTSVNAVVP